MAFWIAARSTVTPSPFAPKFRTLSENRIVGTVVLIARDGEVVYQHAAGHADREAGQNMSVGTLFRLASVTKAIVCASAMAFIERDELSLESRVDRWLPEFRPKLPSGESPEITIRHLLTHTAGLDYRFQQPPDGPYARANVSDGFDHDEATVENDAEQERSGHFASNL